MGHRRIPKNSPETVPPPGRTTWTGVRLPSFLSCHPLVLLKRSLYSLVFAVAAGMVAPGTGVFGTGAAGTVAAQDVYVEQNGVLFREQRYVERRPVASWQWEERQEIVYREDFVTTFREDRRTVQVPVAVASPNGGPPLQRWDLQTQIVRSPVVTRQLVPETRTVRVPVRKLGFVGEERIARVPLGPAPNYTAYPPGTMADPATGFGGGPALPSPQTARRPWKGMAVSGFDPTLNRW
jgi:hypothetical protein